ncbi:MAG: 2-dehydropantoate 2-reductase [Boseongicola sp.]|nr:2-dehydropantoate 2-reductase [Boseongicola sp.]
MKIAIYGTGAMGSVYAGHFCEAGHEVWAVDPWTAHVEAINASGLQLDGASGNRRIEGIRAVTDFAEVGACDLIVIATKMAGVSPAARAIAQHLTPATITIAIQNGLGAAERIGAFMPVDNALLGVADGFGASLKEPGHAHHNAMNLIRIGEIDGGPSDRVEMLAECWRGAGFRVQAFDDIQRLIWEKFLCNVTYSAACTVFDMTVGELQAHPERWAIALGAMQEAYAIARSKKINLAIGDPVAHVTAFGAQMPNARPSMLLDHKAKRISELDAINGQVPELGRALGIPTPYNDTLVAVLRQREAAFDGGPP